MSADIEDGTLSAGRIAYSRYFGSLPPQLFARFVSGGALLATSALAHATPIRPVMTYFGAMPPLSRLRHHKDFMRGPLVAVLVGFLNQDTGLPIIAGAIQKMRSSCDPIFEDLVIRVAGMGPGQEVLRQMSQGSAPRVEILGRLDEKAYRQLLDEAHIGLSLKPVGGRVSETTFPSKTVEYAENGIALIATDISDVRNLFGDAAQYLQSNESSELVARLRSALANRQALAERAELAQRRLDGQLSYPAAGRQLSEFLFRSELR